MNEYSFSCIKIGQFIPKTCEPFCRDINVIVDLTNYETKGDIKNISPEGFVLKSNLASIITETDKLDIDKLVPVPVDVSKLSDVVKIMFLQNPCMIN